MNLQTEDGHDGDVVSEPEGAPVFVDCECGQRSMARTVSTGQRISAQCVSCEIEFVVDGAAAGGELPCACGATIKIPHVRLEAFEEEIQSFGKLPDSDSGSEADSGPFEDLASGASCDSPLEHTSPVEMDNDSTGEQSFDESEPDCQEGQPNHANDANVLAIKAPRDLDDRDGPASDQATVPSSDPAEAAANAEKPAGAAEDPREDEDKNCPLPIIASPQLHTLGVARHVRERLLRAQVVEARRRARLPIVGFPELYQLHAPDDRRDQDSENRGALRKVGDIQLPIVGAPTLYVLISPVHQRKAPVDQREQENEFRSESGTMRDIRLPIVGVPELYVLKAPDGQRDQGNQDQGANLSALGVPLPIVAVPLLHKIQVPVKSDSQAVSPDSLMALRRYASVSLDVSVTTATAISTASESEPSLDSQDANTSVSAEALEEAMNREKPDAFGLEESESLDELRASIERLVEEAPASHADHSAMSEEIATENDLAVATSERGDPEMTPGPFPEDERCAGEFGAEVPSGDTDSDVDAMPVGKESEAPVQEDEQECEFPKNAKASPETPSSGVEQGVFAASEEVVSEDVFGEDSGSESVVCPDCDTVIFVSDRMEVPVATCSCGSDLTATGPQILPESVIQTDKVSITSVATDGTGEPIMPQSEADATRPERGRSRNHHADASAPTHVKGKDMRVEGPILGALVRFASIAILVSIFAGIWSFIRINRQREEVVLKQPALPTRKASPFVGTLASETGRDQRSAAVKQDRTQNQRRAMGTLKPIGLAAESATDLASDGPNDEIGRLTPSHGSLSASQSSEALPTQVPQRDSTSEFLIPLAVRAEQLKQADRLDHQQLSGFADAVKEVSVHPADFSVSDLFWLADCWESFAVRAETSDLAGRCYWQAAAACALVQEIKTIEVEQVALAKRRHADLSDRSRESLRLAVKQSVGTDSNRTRK